MGAKGFSKYGLHTLVEVGNWVDIPAETSSEADRVRNAAVNFATPREWNLSVRHLKNDGIARVTRKF